MDTNGNAPQGPAWTNVDPQAIIGQLTNQIAGMIQVMAMKDAYIEQLHKAIADLTKTEAQNAG